MTDPSRRGFLVVAGAGAASASMAVLADSAFAGGIPDGTSSPTDGPLAVGSGPLVVFVEDVRAGTVTFLTGEQSRTITDRQLVGSLVRLAKKD